MLRTLFTLLLLALALHASDYDADYQKLIHDVPSEQMEKHLADWRTREPDNPDAWIHSANWFFNQSRVTEMDIGGKPLPADTFVLEEVDGKIIARDAKTKRKLGQVNSTTRYEEKAARTAITLLRDAVKRWPQRLDIHCGIAHILTELGALGEVRDALTLMTTQARELRGKLRWCHDEVLGKSEEVFLAEKLQGFALQMFDRQTGPADHIFFQIATLMATELPALPHGFNNLAVYHGLQKDWPAAQKALEQAAIVAPDDALVWANLGDNSVRLKLKTRARECYERVLQLEPDHAEARKALGKLR